MIERKFVSQNFKEFQIKEYVKKSLSRVGLSGVKLQRTSLGERLVISASRPGLIVGRGGSTIQRLTRELKEKFKLENPQIEIEEITDFSLDATVVAESIVSQLERFGTQRFKGVGHKTLDHVMKAKALGVEILISGKIPSARAKTWRFANGYMKKCGDIAITGVDTAKEFANLKTGVVGVQVRIMPGTTVLPDQITFDKRDKEAAILEQIEHKRLEKEVKEVQAEKDREAKKTPVKKEIIKESTKTQIPKDTNVSKKEAPAEAKTKKTSAKKASTKKTSTKKATIKKEATKAEKPKAANVKGDV
jgi:small subunit ribosomal protein S3